LIPEISGTAHLAGLAQWIIDPDDPLRHGFLVR
jgi:trans-L-3-hydroxyproline dehydratase